jgi:hypothetical protein
MTEREKAIRTTIRELENLIKPWEPTITKYWRNNVRWGDSNWCQHQEDGQVPLFYPVFKGNVFLFDWKGTLYTFDGRII